MPKTEKKEFTKSEIEVLRFVATFGCGDFGGRGGKNLATAEKLIKKGYLVGRTGRAVNGLTRAGWAAHRRALAQQKMDGEKNEHINA